jgi:type VI secretion system protein VasJ
VDAADLLERVAKPIRPEAPSGEWARDLPEFASLQAEIQKLGHPDQPAVSWDRVIDLGSALLRDKSKDLLAATYLAYALFERDGYAGLAQGLRVLRTLVADFWETLHPEPARIRARVSAVEWLGERAAVRVRRVPPAGADRDSTKAILELIDEVGQLLAPRIKGGEALLSELRAEIADAVASQGRPEPAAGGTGPSRSADSARSTELPASVSSAEDYERVVPDLKRLLRAVAEHFRRTSPMNPLSYRMARLAAWMSIEQLPTQTAGKTQIPAPQPADLLPRLEQMLASGKPAAILEETEGRLFTAALWLDLQRLSWAALDAQGPPYRPAAEAVLCEVRALVQRLPGLPELRFADDTPLAGEATRAWIRDQVLAAAAAPAAAVSRNGDQPLGGADFAQARSDARALAVEKRLGEAVTILERGAVHASSLADRAVWELELAQLCFDAGQLDTAMGRLEVFDEVLRRSTADDWEPDLCAQVIRLLLLCRQRAASVSRGHPEEMHRTRELMNRLCRLDVAAAVEFSSRK